MPYIAHVFPGLFCYMKTKHKKVMGLGLVLCSPLLGALTGCVGYVEPQHEHVYSQPVPVYVEPAYVYYPRYEVYYDTHSRQYTYRSHHSWVTRPAPRVSVDVLFASPSVTMRFHDHPSHHHAYVVKQYPKRWAPTGRHDGPHYKY